MDSSNFTRVNHSFPTIHRGEREVVLTTTIFLNDGEEGTLQFSIQDQSVRVIIVAEPVQVLKKHPDLEIEPREDCVRITFIGWNAQSVYALIEPYTIAQIHDKRLTFAVCNSYLGRTNKLELQFYLEDSE